MQKASRQVCAPWKWGTEDQHARDQPTPLESSYSTSEAPPSCWRSGRSSGLGGGRNRGDLSH